MKKLLLGLLGLLFILPAVAEEWPPDLQIRQMAGDRLRLGGSATSATVDFQFWTRYVKVCYQPGTLINQGPVYLALATNIAGDGSATTALELARATADSMTYFATDEATFTDILKVDSAGAVALPTCTPGPNCTRIHGSAMPLDLIVTLSSPASTNTGSSVAIDRTTNCFIEPWRTQGIVAFSTTGTSADINLDVWGYR